MHPSKAMFITFPLTKMAWQGTFFLSENVYCKRVEHTLKAEQAAAV